MKLDIAGKKALVCASSKGLGRACAEALCREGVDVTICARTVKTLERTADQLRALGTSNITSVACDITSDEGRQMIINSCPTPDILINNAGGPPLGDFRDWDWDIWISAINANMLTQIFLIKYFVDGMIERKFGRIVNITSSAVKAPIDILGLSNGARCGLTGFCAGLARQIVRHNVTINSILPGPFDTDRLRDTINAKAKKMDKPYEEVVKERTRENPAGRFGDPSEVGYLCAFLSSSYAGYITGQNIVIDGGAYPDTL